MPICAPLGKDCTVTEFFKCSFKILNEEAYQMAKLWSLYNYITTSLAEVVLLSRILPLTLLVLWLVSLEASFLLWKLLSTGCHLLRASIWWVTLSWNLFWSVSVLNTLILQILFLWNACIVKCFILGKIHCGTEFHLRVNSNIIVCLWTGGAFILPPIPIGSLCLM